MAEIAEPVVTTRRSLMLRDSVSFLSLIAVTLVLLAVTLLLFRSFMTHRVDLATSWAARGAKALASGQPVQAVDAYRAALTFAPDEHSYERMLAQALGDAGHTEEAYNYFTELWETHPGDGSINLQLARLAARKRETQDAINFYRASLYGTWEGDGVQRRREVRLELARYLIAQHQPTAARAELLIASGNAPETTEIQMTLAKLLEQAGYPADALGLYRKVLAREPKNARALTNAGALSYDMGDYATAHRLLERAAREEQDPAINPTLLANAERIVQLQPLDTLPDAQRVSRILAIREIARQRWTTCMAESGSLPLLQTLQARWANPDANATRASLMREVDKQNATVTLVYDTEMETSHPPCPVATGDDALLLRLAQAQAGEGATHP